VSWDSPSGSASRGMRCSRLGTLHSARRPDGRYGDDWRRIIMARSLEELHITKLPCQTIPLNKHPAKRKQDDSRRPEYHYD